MAPPKQKALDSTKVPAPPPKTQTGPDATTKPAVKTGAAGSGATPTPAKPMSNTERAAQVRAAHNAKRQFESWEPRDLTIDDRAVGPSPPCSHHSCHDEPSKHLVWNLPPIDLQGSTFFPLTDSLIKRIWKKPFDVKQIPVRYGSIAKGYLQLYADAVGRLWTPDGPQTLTFFHPALPPLSASEAPVLAIEIADSVIFGGLSKQSTVSSYKPAGPSTVTLLNQEQAATLAGLDDLHDLKIGRFVNVVERGQFRFELGDLQFKFDSVFPGKGNFSIDKAKPLDATADVEAVGIAKQSIEIERDPDAQLSAGKNLVVELKPPKRAGEEWSGGITARFARGQFDIRGTIDYRSPSGEIVGSATLLLTDEKSAWAAVNQRLGDKAPVGGAPSASSTGLALVGWGVLDFNLSKWLRGRAEVVVDPEGYITTLGRLEPTVTYNLFDKQTLPTKGLPGTSMDLQIPIVGELLHVDGGFSFKASGWYGPGTLFDITAEGVYSTNPRIPVEFDVGATLAVPAEAKLVLEIWGGIALGDGPISAGIRLSLTGTATLRAYAEARPHIARRRVRGAKDTATEYTIKGHMDVAAALDVGLKGEIELHVLTVKLASVDSWAVTCGG